jgi:integrase
VAVDPATSRLVASGSQGAPPTPWRPRSAGLAAEEWTPRELRHSFVSLLSSSDVPIEDIAHLVGHASTAVTEKVYRRELRPVLTKGATAMDRLFAHDVSPPASPSGRLDRPEGRTPE